MQQLPSRACLLAALVLAVAGPAAAQPVPPAPPTQGVLNLSANAQVEVTKDLLQVVFAAVKEGPDAAAVQAGLKQAIEAALAEARKVAKPGQVDVQTGNFSLHPRYSQKGVVNGWQGRAELTVEGRDMPTIAQLTGRMPTVVIQRVGYGLSREAREKVEGEVTAQAIARYRAKAEQFSKQFGYGGYTIREVSVMTDEPMGGGPVPMMAARADGMVAEQSLPVEPGKGRVTATVSGSVQMK